jgi:peptidyl-prolyl cis-trans isomerase C
VLSDRATDGSAASGKNPDAAVPGQPSLLRRWSREPLVQFLLIGLVLFVGYSVLHPRSEATSASNRIVLTPDDLVQMSVAWLAQGRPPPTPEQMQNLIELKVREEVLFREAMALGLDKDDTIVKRHLYFSSDRHGERTREAAAKALEQITAQSGEAKDVAALGDPFMYQDYYGDRSFDDMAKLFGLNFARALVNIRPGSWQGPVESGYGWHLIFVDSSAPSRVPTFEEIEPDIKASWIADQRAQAKAKAYETMRARYQVVLPEKP